MESNAMAALDKIGQEKQKIAHRLERLDAERGKLAEQLNELEVAERVLSRFEKPERKERHRPDRPAKAAATAAKPTPRRRGQAAAKQPGQPSVSDAALKAVQGHPQGVSAGDVLKQLSMKVGLSVRPNHLGVALQRHRRAGRLEQRGSLWFPRP
ncbi:MAG TPA: hypothetical protein VJ770_15615 [Stellaceae bacterium]|nr:hypothetical protein [Stellaceae bacterium]